ncbi:ABC transporter permease [Microbacterium aurantiacum]|uniref:ABC transporter permease n=1 Tax=Microbacterium aurantiacum TaxID=162393 RepID=A0AAJ2HKC5_9MICO|nr:ABC transporter permease [Microbacterium aurantiacum]MBN9200524.1 ABC transporter permease [Microbacterium chocolatum]MDN4463009.1 ABC transporter permease [Microbacterium aurantiacum]MDS0244493.1 ABC transporter permease [Microbacterium aurantiacum]ODT11930.1 MAG: ABC transporter permease [Microbacterium sp. SCN 70-18]
MSSREIAVRPGGTLRLFANELATQFRRGRTLAMLGALALIPILLGVAIRIAGSSSPGRGPAFLDQITGNGLFVALAALTVAIPLFLPLTVSVAAGDAIAGEAASGTLRYLLLVPSGRARLLAVKYAWAVVFCLTAAVLVVVVGTIVGWILFPVGPVTLLTGTEVSVVEGVGRVLLIAGYAALSLCGLAAIGLFFSTLTSVPIGAMAATAILAVAAQIVGAIPQLEALHPWLFTDRWLDFGDLLRAPIVWDGFAQNALLQGAYIVVFVGAALWRFARKDILT